MGRMHEAQTECWFDSLATTVPVFCIGNFEALDKPAVNISFLPGHKSGAESYALAVEEVCDG